MSFSAPLISELLALIPADQQYVGLFITNPMLVHDPLTVEVSGPLYARQSGLVARTGGFSNPSIGLRFYGLSRGTAVTYLGSFDAPANGNLLYALRTPAKYFPEGGYYLVNPGGFVVDLI